MRPLWMLAGYVVGGVVTMLLTCWLDGVRDLDIDETNLVLAMFWPVLAPMTVLVLLGASLAEAFRAAGHRHRLRRETSANEAEQFVEHLDEADRAEWDAELARRRN